MNSTRRQALVSLSAAGTVLLAGCLTSSDDDTDESNENNNGREDEQRENETGNGDGDRDRESTNGNEGETEDDDDEKDESEPSIYSEPKDITEQVGPGIEHASIITVDVRTDPEGHSDWVPDSGMIDEIAANVDTITDDHSIDFGSPYVESWVEEKAELGGDHEWGEHEPIPEDEENIPEDPEEIDVDDDSINQGEIDPTVVYAISTWGPTNCHRLVEVEELNYRNDEFTIDVSVTSQEPIEDICYEEETYLISLLLVEYEELPVEGGEFTIRDGWGATTTYDFLTVDTTLTGIFEPN